MDAQTRQEYIRAAVSFLQNPKLVESSLQDKLQFLKDKGLSQVEVDEALNLALINRHQTQSGKWNFFLVLGLCIGGYKLYQAYMESKAELNGEASLTVKNKSEQASKRHVKNISETGKETDPVTLTDILKRISELKWLMDMQRNNLQTEIQSIKTLLLGHEKFAAPPVIPAWQLKEDGHKEGLNENESKVSDGLRTNEKEIASLKKHD